MPDRGPEIRSLGDTAWPHTYLEGRGETVYLYDLRSGQFAKIERARVSKLPNAPRPYHAGLSMNVDGAWFSGNADFDSLPDAVEWLAALADFCINQSGRKGGV